MTPGVSMLRRSAVCCAGDFCRAIDSHLRLELLHDIEKAIVNIGFLRELDLTGQLGLPIGFRSIRGAREKTRTEVPVIMAIHLTTASRGRHDGDVGACEGQPVDDSP